MKNKQLLKLLSALDELKSHISEIRENFSGIGESSKYLRWAEHNLLYAQNEIRKEAVGESGPTAIIKREEKKG